MKKIFSCILALRPSPLAPERLRGGNVHRRTLRRGPRRSRKFKLDLRDRQVEVSASTDGRSTFAIPKAIANFTASRRKTEF